MSKEGVERRVGLKDTGTAELLMIYFGLSHGRSVRKNDLRDELVVRGVSVALLTDALEQYLRVVGNARDNYIPEIDDQGKAEES
jgi:hypothetical protein